MTLSFKYPITKADGTEFKSAKELLVQMQGESSGFYLMSAHGFWHGGVHISDSTAPYAVDSYPVRAIADGVVVAQRLNREYLISTWGQGDQAQSLKYSTSFCLIEHSYESPHKKSPSASAPAPAAARGATTRTPAPAPAASADQGPQNKLVFFSLYMHLLPYEGYAQKLTLQSGSVSAYVQLPTGGGTAPATTSLASPGPGQASNPVPVPDAGTIPASVTLAAGTQFSVLDEAQVMLDGKPTRLFYVRVEGTPPAGGTGTHYWITAGAQWTADNGKTPLICPTYWKTHKVTAATKKTINARQAPSGEHIGAPIHTIPAGTTVEIQSEKSLKLPGGRRPQPFVEATILSLGPGATGTLAAGSTVWLSGDRDFLARDPVIPEAFDQVVVLPTPGHPIKAGDPIGYLGLYETPSDGNSGKLSKHQLHLEVFTGDPAFADFFANKAGLTTEGKMFKVAPSGTRPSRRSADGSFSPASDQFSVATMVDTSGGAAVEDAQHVKWYSADGIGFNGVLSGWVSEKQLRDVSQFDWGKLGFQKVEETNDNADGYMDPDQLPDFFKQIYRIIDKNSDNDVSADELVTANKNPAVAYALSHAVAKHPSEWQGKSDAAKWKVLKEKDQLLKNDPTRLKHESERIDKLVWWDDVKRVEKFPLTPNVWHFHPIRLIDTLMEGCTCGCCLGEIFDRYRYGNSHGPGYKGGISLQRYPRWATLISQGKITNEEKEIISTLSSTEGNMDALQAYDDQALTAGAMQKTINTSGTGELATQIYKFKQKHEDLYEKLFRNCGWIVDGNGSLAKLYYSEDGSGDDKITGSALKEYLRSDFQSPGGQRSSRPLASVVNAIRSDEYLDIQIDDFKIRLDEALGKAPSPYQGVISDYIKSILGRSTVLDHSVNRPGYVASDFSAALKDFFNNNPAISRDPSAWGMNHAEYERKIVDYYGVHRRGTDMANRYAKIKAHLGVK